LIAPAAVIGIVGYVDTDTFALSRPLGAGTRTLRAYFIIGTLRITVTAMLRVREQIHAGIIAKLLAGFTNAVPLITDPPTFTSVIALTTMLYTLQGVHAGAIAVLLAIFTDTLPV
jgi:hypothetical protein